MSTSLSVFVPVYNERFLVAASLERLKVLATSEDLERVEVIVVLAWPPRARKPWKP